MDLEFSNLTYTVAKRSLKGGIQPNTILKSVSGRFYSGHLSAIMGPSGAGKSSLLNAISGYRSKGVTGQLYAGGKIMDSRIFHKRSCYLTQDDSVQPLMTVGELMYLVAALKLSDKSKTTRQNTIDDILKNLSLKDHEDTRTECLSGGQRKRLCIALELINNPPVFFLDEPTSGLDQVTTMNCIKLLRNLAKQGRTVICTIHQPSASIFEQFDQVYVLAQGMCIYQGATSALVPFLKSSGIPCPMHHNPADYVIEVTESQKHIQLLSDAMENGKAFHISEQSTSLIKLADISTDNNEKKKQDNFINGDVLYNSVKNQYFRKNSRSSIVSQVSNISTTMAWLKMKKFSVDADIDYATSSFTQFKYLLLRMFLQISRNKTGIWIQIVHHLLCGTLIGLIFYGTGNDGIRMFEHLKYCIGVTIFFAYTQIMVPVLVYPSEVKLVKKEYFNRWYGLMPYYAALTVSKLPLQIALNILFCSLVYFMAGLPNEIFRFGVFCLVGNMTSLVAEGMGLAIGAFFSVTNGCAIGPLAIAPFLGLAIYGFDFAKNIPLFMNILMKMSFIRCGVVALALTVFGFERETLDCNDVYCHFAKPQVLLEFLDIARTTVWLEIGILILIMFIFRVLCYLALRYRFST